MTEAQKKAQKKYDSKATVRYGLKLNKKTDADVIAWLESISEGKQTYIKRLIREDIERRA